VKVDIDVFGVPGAGKTSTLRAIDQPGVAIVIDRPGRPARWRRARRRLQPPVPVSPSATYADHPTMLRLAAEAAEQEPDRSVRATKIESVETMAVLHQQRPAVPACIWDAGWCQRALGLFTGMDGNVGAVEPFVDALPKADIAVMFDVDTATSMERMAERGFRPIVLRGQPDQRVRKILDGFRECAERVADRAEAAGVEVVRLDGRYGVEENAARLVDVAGSQPRL
jgi:hypothetical protein